MATHADWLSLVELDGLVISEPVLEEHFPEGPIGVPKGMHHWFRRRAERYSVARDQADRAKHELGARQWIDFLLEDLCELPRKAWLKANDVPAELSVHLAEFEQELRPDRVLRRGERPVLLVNIVAPDQALDRRDRQAGRWKASPTTKLDRLLRETGVPLGLLTNGDDFRLLYAPREFSTGSITWTTRILTEEKATLDALYSLCGRDLLLPDNAEAYTLSDLCRISQDRQGEVADQLGEQVRNGLERLIWAWDAADRDSGGKLLAGMTEDDIYEMGLVVMMRLVFLLYAEERHLLPHGEVLYDQGYGLTYLWHRAYRATEAPAKLAVRPRCPMTSKLPELGGRYQAGSSASRATIRAVLRRATFSGRGSRCGRGAASRPARYAPRIAPLLARRRKAKVQPWPCTFALRRSTRRRRQRSWCGSARALCSAAARPKRTARLGR